MHDKIYLLFLWCEYVGKSEMGIHAYLILNSKDKGHVIFQTFAKRIFYCDKVAK